MDIALKKEFLKNEAASVSLSMNDIFRKKVYRTFSTSNFSKKIYSTQENERFRDPQMVRLNFNWRFGNSKIQAPKRKNGGASDEQNRVKTGSN